MTVSPSLNVKADIELPINEDNPTSLAVNNGNIYAGVNRSAQQIQSGRNDHLRVLKYQDEVVSSAASYSIFPVGDVNEYQKITRVSDDGLTLAILSSAAPSKIYVLESTDLTRQTITISHPNNPADINDFSLSPGSGQHVAFCSNEALHVADSQTGENLLSIEVPRSDLVFSKISFVNDSKIVAVLNVKGRKGFWLYHFDLDWKEGDNSEPSEKDENEESESPAYSVASFKHIAKKGSAVAFAAGSKYIAIASSDFTIYVTTCSFAGSIKTIKDAHSFAVTSLALSRDESVLASTSVDNTVKIFSLPENGRLSGSAPVMFAVASAVLAALLVLILGLLLERVIQKQLISDLIRREPSSVEPSGQVESSIEWSTASASGTIPVGESVYEDDVVSVTSEGPEHAVTATPEWSEHEASSTILVGVEEEAVFVEDNTDSEDSANGGIFTTDEELNQEVDQEVDQNTSEDINETPTDILEPEETVHEAAESTIFTEETVHETAESTIFTEDDESSQAEEAPQTIEHHHDEI